MTSTRRGTDRSPLTTRLGVGVLVVLACPLAVVMAGALVPEVPGLGTAGSVLAVYASWVAVLGLLLGATALVTLRRRRTRPRVVAALAALVVVLTAGTVTAAQVATAARHGVAVSPVDVVVPPSADDADETLAYPVADGSTRRMLVWRPQDPTPDEPAPVLLTVHGGGWIDGSPEGSVHARWFAERGWLVLSPEYDLSDEDTPRWDEVEIQIGCALAWADVHAGELGGDARRVVVAGESAGGNLAINTSYRAAADTPPTPCGDVPPIAAVATLYPAVDAAFGHENPEPVMGTWGRSMVEQYTGGTPAEVPDRYEAISSAPHLSAQAPPTFIGGAMSDHLVPHESVVRFTREVEAAGVPVHLVEVPYAEHGFDTGPGAGAAIYRQGADAWFAHHGVTP